jgi:hypothetical protein
LYCIVIKNTCQDFKHDERWLFKLKLRRAILFATNLLTYIFYPEIIDPQNNNFGVREQVVSNFLPSEGYLVNFFDKAFS